MVRDDIKLCFWAELGSVLYKSILVSFDPFKLNEKRKDREGGMDFSCEIKVWMISLDGAQFSCWQSSIFDSRFVVADNFDGEIWPDVEVPVSNDMV